MKLWLKIITLIFVMVCAILFLLDDCINENTIPHQDFIIRIIYFLCVSIGEFVLLGGMIGLYDSDIPESSRMFWRIVFGILFSGLSLGILFMLLKVICIHN